MLSEYIFLNMEKKMRRNKVYPIVIVILLAAIIFWGIQSSNNSKNNISSNENDSSLSNALDDSQTAGDTQEEETGSQSATQANINETSSPESITRAKFDNEKLFFALWESWELIHEYFVYTPIDDNRLYKGAIDGLNTILEEYEIDLSMVVIPEDAATAEDIAKEANTPQEIMTEFLPFWELWRKVEYSELPEGLTYDNLMESALSGMVNSLGDPYTSYLDPQEFRDLEIGLEGEYEGIGAWVDITTEYLTIIAPMKGSPAEKAGLLPGDQVIGIDGEDMTGIDGELVRLRVLGPAGTKVVLTIDRDGVDEPFDVEIIRSHIVMKNVESEMLDNGIAYLQLMGFRTNSDKDLNDALEDLMAQNPTGLILDLRSNGGGYLHIAINITSEFIADGVILYEEYGDGTREIHEVQSFKGDLILPRKGLATEIPLVVLVNEGSASASEILAGAIQDHGRGYLVGTVTFGKGSVQQPFTLSNEKGVLKITIARWLTPNERHIHGQGLEPDYIVEITDEDIEANIDTQLEKAIELLTSP